jgi:hypothetical protein
MREKWFFWATLASIMVRGPGQAVLETLQVPFVFEQMLLCFFSSPIRMVLMIRNNDVWKHSNHCYRRLHTRKYSDDYSARCLTPSTKPAIIRSYSPLGKLQNN